MHEIGYVQIRERIGLLERLLLGSLMYVVESPLIAFFVCALCSQDVTH